MGRDNKACSFLNLPEDSIPLLRPDGSMRTLAEIEGAAIDYALQVAGSRKGAAEALGIGRATLYRYIGSARLLPERVHDD
jgi:DNA-binding NtrC family response regulator